MASDRSYLRAMRLLPFSAAATNQLAFSMQTSRMRVISGRWCRSEALAGRLGSMLGRCGCCTCCCTLPASLTFKCQFQPLLVHASSDDMTGT